MAEITIIAATFATPTTSTGCFGFFKGFKSWAAQRSGINAERQMIAALTVPSFIYKSKG